MSRTVFTVEQDNAMLNMFAAGHTDSQIAVHLGLTKGQVVGRRHRVQGKTFKSDAARLVRRKEAAVPKYDPRKHGKNSARIVMDNALRVSEERLLDKIHAPVEPKEEAAPVGPVIRGMPWKHPRGCQWHMGREGLKHLFCGESTSAGSWCDAHAKRVFMPRKALANAA